MEEKIVHIVAEPQSSRPVGSTDPAAHHDGWADPTLLHKNGYNRLVMLGRVLGILAGLILDAVLIMPLFELPPLSESRLGAGVVALLLAGMPTLGMFVGGRLGAVSRGNRRPVPKTATALVVLWVGVGLTIAVLRATLSTVSTDAGSVGTQDAAPTAGLGGGAFNYVYAAALALAYGVTGLLAWMEGHEYNAAWSSLIRVRERLVAATSDTNHWAGIMTRLSLDRVRGQADLKHVESLAASEARRSQANLDWAMSRARVLIAEKIGTVQGTGATSAKHPDHPDYSESGAREGTSDRPQ